MEIVAHQQPVEADGAANDLAHERLGGTGGVLGIDGREHDVAVMAAGASASARNVAKSAALGAAREAATTGSSRRSLVRGHGPGHA